MTALPLQASNPPTTGEFLDPKWFGIEVCMNWHCFCGICQPKLEDQTVFHRTFVYMVSMSWYSSHFGHQTATWCVVDMDLISNRTDPAAVLEFKCYAEAVRPQLGSTSFRDFVVFTKEFPTFRGKVFMFTTVYGCVWCLFFFINLTWLNYYAYTVCFLDDFFFANALRVTTVFALGINCRNQMMFCESNHQGKRDCCRVISIRSAPPRKALASKPVTVGLPVGSVCHQFTTALFRHRILSPWMCNGVSAHHAESRSEGRMTVGQFKTF